MLLYEWTFVKTRSNKVAQWCPYNDFGAGAVKQKRTRKRRRLIPLNRMVVVVVVVFGLCFFLFFSLRCCFVFILNLLVCYCIMHFVCLPNILNSQFGLGATIIVSYNELCLKCVAYIHIHILTHKYNIQKGKLYTEETSRVFDNIVDDERCLCYFFHPKLFWSVSAHFSLSLSQLLKIKVFMLYFCRPITWKQFIFMGNRPH